MGFLSYVAMLYVEPLILKIIVGISVGILSYLLLSIITKDPSFLEIKGILKKKLNR